MSTLSNIPYLAMFRKADQLGRITAHPLRDYPVRKFITPTATPTHTVTLLVGIPSQTKSDYTTKLATPVITSFDIPSSYHHVDVAIDMPLLSLSSRRAIMQHFQYAQFKCVMFFQPTIATDQLELARTFTIPVPQEGFTSIDYIFGD